ncbi:hypothetical protein A3D12_01375 [Candidatus Peribacteria bacterium RIFCSPHIGHO2_02_FULL_55_24]|nr:MAG: hypothetical protein A3D12_01375 [Candidatus Peribacteria bacterium RIFCSPHIGHO2_02_FULL_55_24]
MRRFLLLGSGSILLIIGLITAESILLHPLPRSSQTPPSTETTNQEHQNRVQDIIAQMQFTTQESAEDTLLKQIATNDVPTNTLVLLAENDRSGLLSWIKSPDAHLYFSALKEALSASFSPELHDLRDDREELPKNRTREILSFRDPALSAEQITIILSGNTIYEFHISPGKEERISPLIEALTM